MDITTFFVMGCLVAALGSAAAQDALGPYECLMAKTVGQCPGTEDLPIVYKWRMRRYGKNLYSNGEWTIPFAWDDKISMNGAMYKWTNNGWQFYAKSTANNACQTIKTLFPKIFKQWADSQGAPLSCPWPAGTYYIKNFTTCLKPSRFPMLPYGRMLFELNSTRQGKQVSCLLSEMVIEPTFKRLPVIG